MKYKIDKSIPQGASGHLDKAQDDWLRLMPDGWDGTPSVGATDVLHAVDQLRRDLSGYQGQLKAHDDLQRHCDNQRKRIGELEMLYAGAKAERDKLLELIEQHEMGCGICGEEAERLNNENAKLLHPLLTENAKLRKLCADLYEFAMDEYPEGTELNFAASMRELGIEVDE